MILPYPALTITLLAIWLLLHRTIDPPVIAAGSLLAFLLPFAFAALERPRLVLRRIDAAILLAATIVFDVVRSNLAVGSIILSGRRRKRVSGFVTIPIAMTNPHGLAILAVIITSTPGTLWAQYNSGRREVLLHVLDLVEPQYWVDLIKRRYERHLMEIFP